MSTRLVKKIRRTRRQPSRRLSLFWSRRSGDTDTMGEFQIHANADVWVMLCFFSALEDAGGFFEVVSPCRFGRLARLTYMKVLQIWLPQLGLRIDCLPKPCPLQKALCSRQEAGAKNAAGAVFFLQASIVNCKQHVISQHPSFVQKWLKDI